MVLAYGTNYADALAGVSLAATMKAPILLTNTDSLPRETTNAIEKLGAKNIVILGGTGAISEAVENTLKQQKLSTERIAGSTRFETATKIAEKLQYVTGEEPEEIFFAPCFSIAFVDSLGRESVLVSSIGAFIAAASETPASASE